MNALGRTFVLEIAGLPAAGKSTTAIALKQHLESLGLSVGLLAAKSHFASFEANMKFSWLFNSWRLTKSISDLIEYTATSERDVVIFDRGVWDSIAWIRWFASNDQVSTSVRKQIESFASIPEWFGHINMVAYLSVSIDVAVQRRGSQGRIVNPGTFEELEQSYTALARETVVHLGNPTVITRNTDGCDLTSITTWLLDEIAMYARSSCLDGRIYDCFAAKPISDLRWS